LKLSPTLSYMMLFTIGLMSFFIVHLEYIERDGGPAVWFVCALIALISFIALLIGAKREKASIAPNDFCRFLLVGPIWLWHFVFKKLNVRY